jgi:hypothetical protein
MEEREDEDGARDSDTGDSHLDLPQDAHWPDNLDFPIGVAFIVTDATGASSSHSLDLCEDMTPETRAAIYQAI